MNYRLHTFYTFLIYCISACTIKFIAQEFGKLVDCGDEMDTLEIL